MADPALIGMAAGFAVVTGANDGGALLSTGLKLRGIGTITAIAALSAFVVAAPLLLSSAVAQTFTSRLVADEGSGRTALLLGIAAAVVVITVLTATGRPTSLTLAVIGGITGAGMGYGLPVSFAAVATVLMVGLAAPFVGGLIGYLLSRFLVLLPARPNVDDTITRTHRVAFALQCLAYGVNDGQKMLAVLMIASGAGTFHADVGEMLMLAAFFILGILLGLPRAARSLGDGLFAVRPVHAVSAEFAGAFAVLSSALVGVPVSMTQSLAGGLVGAGVSHGAGRIRWLGARKIGLAWLMTLPAAVAVAAVAAAAARMVS